MASRGGRAGSKGPAARRARPERKEADHHHHHAAADEAADFSVPVGAYVACRGKQTKPSIRRIGNVHRLFSTVQETQMIVPEDQVKLSSKELDEDITRFVFRSSSTVYALLSHKATSITTHPFSVQCLDSKQPASPSKRGHI